MKPFKAGVIGLGNIGFRFNLDPKRKETWSHVSAYERCQDTELAAAVEINRETIDLFSQQYGNVPVFDSVGRMMEHLDIDIASICTPTESHAAILEELAAYPVKAIFCEKPFAASIDEGARMVRLCEGNGIVLAVNHTRRWDAGYITVRDMIRDGKIGNVTAINALYPGQVFNIGTHLIDTVRMFIEKDVRAVSGISFNIDNRDPNISGWIDFGGCIPFTMLATGKREDLIFEIDVVGTEGRIRSLENGDKVEWYAFDESQRYSGYRELVPMPVKPVSKNDRLVEAVKDITAVLKGEKKTVNCAGIDGLLVVSIALSLEESGKNNGRPVSLVRTVS